MVAVGFVQVVLACGHLACPIQAVPLPPAAVPGLALKRSDASANILGFLPDTLVAFPVVSERYLLKVDADAVAVASAIQEASNKAPGLVGAKVPPRSAKAAERARPFPSLYAAGDRESDLSLELLYLLHTTLLKVWWPVDRHQLDWLPMLDVVPVPVAHA